MRVILLISLLIASFYSKAQEEFPMLKEVIKIGSLEKVKKYLLSASERKECLSDCGRYIRLHREIIPGYNETMISICSCSPIDASSETLSLHHLNILSKDSSIFYYSFINYYRDSLLWSDSDENEVSKFEKSFLEFYGAPLEFKYLFIDSITFGTMCGIDGIPPKHCELVEEFVKQKDIKSLQQWIRSPNTELQLYAAYGFKELSSSGYIIDEKMRKLMHFILNKIGNAQVCIGCSGENMDIKDIKRYFELE